ncbi:MAG TPA: macrolide family glycosyltransferase [Roseiflexaceae bacterium]|nr:macrolide family glycosyltransferase [Roseiflexaceae bacterium]
MSHIAFCVPAAAGHVNPTLGVAAELVARGHQVSYAVTTSYADRISELGAKLVPYQTARADSGPPPQFTAKDFPRAMRGALREARFVLPQVIEGYRGGEPDVVVHDASIAWWGRIAAATWKAPVVPCWPNFVGNKHWSLNTYIKLNPFHPAFLFALWQASRLARPYGLTLANLLSGEGADAQLVFLPRAFQFAGDTFEAPYAFVGPCLTERAFQGSWQPPAGRKVVLISLGTAYHNQAAFFRACLAAFNDPSWHVVMAIGDVIDRSDLGPIPSHVEVHTFAPQLQVLRHAAAFVSHAGMGSTMEALSFGVPIVAVPQMTEQQANADRIAELGLGVHLPPAEVTAERLRNAVYEIATSERIAANLGEMRAEIVRAGGAKAAADVVERVLADRKV